MEIGRLESYISTPVTSLIGGLFPLWGIVLGELTPSKFNRMEIFYSLILDKARGRIVGKCCKNITIQGVLSRSITSKTPLIMDTRMNTIIFSSVGMEL
jgi:hypothetical protein